MLNPTTNKAYRNTGSVSLGAMATLTIPIRAVEAGSTSTSTAGTITAFETPVLGVTVSNAVEVVGRDEELDPALRARCSEKLGSLSPFGPWDAYTYAARNATRADGTLVTTDTTGSIHRVGAHVQGLDACNGWTFWQFELPGGGYAPIDLLRQRLRAELA